jgi:hypothetical protein
VLAHLQQRGVYRQYLTYQQLIANKLGFAQYKNRSPSSNLTSLKKIEPLKTF